MKHTIVFVILISLLITSCREALVESKDIKKEKSLIGNWQFLPDINQSTSGKFLTFRSDNTLAITNTVALPPVLGCVYNYRVEDDLLIITSVNEEDENCPCCEFGFIMIPLNYSKTNYFSPRVNS